MPHLRETSKNHDYLGPGILRAVGLAELRLKSLSSMGIKNICEILRKNLKKYLQSAKPYGIIIKRDCNRYAMMREVAVQRDGEFPRSMSDLKPGEWDNGHCLWNVIAACVCISYTILCQFGSSLGKHNGFSSFFIR